MEVSGLAEEWLKKVQLECSKMRSVYFGPFRLEIRPHPHDPGELLLRLFRNGDFQALERLQLRLLRFLADEHPGEEVSIDEIAAAVWPAGSGGDNVQKQISLLRGKLGDQIRPYQIIDTLRDSGAYKFIARVRADGDFERVAGLPKWSTRRLLEFFAKLRRNDEDKEDLRIVTSGLVPSRQDLDLEDYLRRDIRIRIVMINPANRSLLEARYALRQDKYTTDDAESDIAKQVEHLRDLMALYPPGTLEVHLSNAMPSGLIFHAKEWAVLGMFPAQGSYFLGPLIETTQHTALWRNLYDDWKIRWDNPAQRLTPIRRY